MIGRNDDKKIDVSSIKTVIAINFPRKGYEKKKFAKMKKIKK